MPKVIDDEKVFQAVVQTIVEHGYSGTTTRQMAEAAGISEVTLFRKYESKRLLVKRAIAAIIEQAQFEDATRYSGDVQEDLFRVLQAYQRSVGEHGQFFAILFSEISRSSELASSVEQPEQLFQAIGQMLKRYQTAGILKPEHPLHAAAALLGPLIYLTMIGSTLPDSQLPPLDLHTHARHFLDGRAI